MTRLVLSAGVLALLLPIAIAAPVAAQEDCQCLRADGPLQAFTTPGAFAFWTGNNARIGVGFSADEQEGYFDVGALISQVEEDSPAEEAGLEVGDVVVAVDGHSLMEPLERSIERRINEDGSVPVQRLMALARAWEPGEEVRLDVLRDGSEMEFDVMPEERDFAPLRLHVDGAMRDSFEQLAPLYEEALRSRERSLEENRNSPRFRVWSGDGEGFEFGVGSWSINGLQLIELNPQLGSYFGVESGVLVTDVSEDSELGLEPGDVILRIGDREVRRPADVRRILRSYDSDEEVRMEVRRHDTTEAVSGTVR